MLSNKERVIQAVENNGKIGVAGLSALLNLDKGTVRKVALEAAREGRIRAWNDGQGYTFFQTAGARHSAHWTAIDVPMNKADHPHRFKSSMPASGKSRWKHLPKAGL